jgi:hypothetical protein
VLFLDRFKNKETICYGKQKKQIFYHKIMLLRKNIKKTVPTIETKKEQFQLELGKELQDMEDQIKIQGNEVNKVMEEINKYLAQVEDKSDSFGFESDQLVQQIRFLCQESFKE